jgi:hypothetical protein
MCRLLYSLKDYCRVQKILSLAYILSKINPLHDLTSYFFKLYFKILGTKRDEVTGEWMKLHNEDLHILYSSPNIIKQIKSRRMRSAGHVARMGEERVQSFGGKARRKETTRKTKS